MSATQQPQSPINWHPRLDCLPFSPIRKMFNAAVQLQDVCNLGIGQPDFPTPPHVREAFIAAINAGKTGYEMDAGLPQLREALAQSYSERHGVALKPENFLITTGCCQALYLSLSSLSLPGKQVITPEPAFITARIAEMGGAKLKRYATYAKDAYQFDAADFSAQIDDDVCAVLLNSPGNPTGTVLSKDTIQTVLDACTEKNIPLVSDEVYDRMVLEEGAFVSALDCNMDLNRTFICSSFSKTYSMAGLRVGWVISSEENIKTLQRLHMFVSTTENTPSQWAALAAVQGPQDCIDEMVNAYRTRRDFVCDRLEQCQVLDSYRPRGAFFVMPSLPTGTDADDTTWRMLHEAKVCTVPGSAFGESCRNAFRISFACSGDTLNKALDRMIPWLEKQYY